MIGAIWYYTGWWSQSLWKIWVRQLGWWHSQYMGKMFQTTNQLYIYICWIQIYFAWKDAWIHLVFSTYLPERIILTVSPFRWVVEIVYSKARTMNINEQYINIYVYDYMVVHIYNRERRREKHKTEILFNPHKKSAMSSTMYWRNPQAIHHQPSSSNKLFISGWWFQPLWKILVKWEYYSQYMET